MLTTGTRLGPYEIRAPLGRGGMGEVYRARDLRLDREVAVKVLSGPRAQDPEYLARFEREAKAVAALAHPNILVLYDFGSEQGLPFAVTELLEGETLRARLARSPLSWREAVEIGAAVADGLAAAHAKGIVHRDLKPENLFLTADGRVKILDFGLARVETPPPLGLETGPYVPAPTDPGMVMGTVWYMSPEQVRGLTVDARSDLYSLGCVLHELVTGCRPFRGRTAADVIASILHDEPPPMGRPGVSVPPEVERAVRRCLARDPGQRFPSARDLAAALRTLLVSAALPPHPAEPGRKKSSGRRREGIASLAVLPLVNLNADPDSEYLSDGLTESIINLLSQLPGLRVMARSTVFRYKGREVDVLEVGRALKVRAILTGRLAQRGHCLVVDVELVDVRDGSRLWGEHYEREFTDVFAMENVIAREIADKLRLGLSGRQKERLGRPLTVSTEAYQCYLKGRYQWNKRSAEALKKGIRLFEQAIEIDPTYALAYTGIADAYLNLGGWGHLPSREAYPRAKAAATRALAIDEDLAEAHVSLAMALKEYDWDWAGAGDRYRRALELNPNYAVAHQWYGEYLAALGRHEEAIEAFKRAIDLDPLSLIIHATLGRHGYYFARQYDRAIGQLLKTLEMDDRFWVAHYWLGIVYARIDRFPEALAALETARGLDDNLEIVACLGVTHALAGRRAEAEQIQEQLRRLCERRYVSPILEALLAVALGEHDGAFAWLEKACEDRVQMMSELQAEPLFDPLRPDPRFTDLLRRVGLAGNT